MLGSMDLQTKTEGVANKIDIPCADIDFILAPQDSPAKLKEVKSSECIREDTFKDQSSAAFDHHTANGWVSLVSLRSPSTAGSSLTDVAQSLRTAVEALESKTSIPGEFVTKQGRPLPIPMVN